MLPLGTQETGEGSDQGYWSKCSSAPATGPGAKAAPGTRKDHGAGSAWKASHPLSAGQRGLLPQTPEHLACCPTASQGRAQLVGMEARHRKGNGDVTLDLSLPSLCLFRRKLAW